MEGSSFRASSNRGKLPLSRLEPAPPIPPRRISNEKKPEERVPRACKTCRKRKVKCSGETPSCSNCRTNLLECVYEQARRDRLKESTDLNSKLVTLLRELSDRVADADRQKIENVLGEAEEDLMTQPTNPSFLSLGKRSRTSTSRDEEISIESPSTTHGEALVTASVGSNEDLDNLNEDLTRDKSARATGYVGQNSEVQWLSSVQRQTEHPRAEPYGQPQGPPGRGHDAATARSDAHNVRRNNAKAENRQGSMLRITDSTFYLDGDDIDAQVLTVAHDDPEPDVAEHLLRSYYMTVHPSFPLVPESFESEARSYVKALRNNAPFRAADAWKAQLNLLFAIGAKYSYLMGAEWEGNGRDDLLYMNRATQLLEPRRSAMMIAEPEVPVIQATGALSFYFLIIGHVSRAWIMIGISIRLALALGLHLRNEDPTLGGARRNEHEQTWWALHSIECLVSAITGRPPVVTLEDCTVLFPKNPQGEQPDQSRPSRQATRRRTEYSPFHAASNVSGSINSQQGMGLANYRYSQFKLSLITQRVLFGLYSPRTATKAWTHVQKEIGALLSDLGKWENTALPGNVQKETRKPTAEMSREETLLSLEFWSTKILVTRPCLCRTERRIRNESDKSASFNASTAEACVGAALEMTELFPDRPDPKWLFENAPWWTIVHLIMQAMAVLLLELGYDNQHMKNSEPSMVVSLKKLILWLSALETNDPVAARAYKVTRKILLKVAPSLQAEANELLSVDRGADAPQFTQHGPHGVFGSYSGAHVGDNEFLTGTPAFEPPLFQSQSSSQMPGHQEDLDRVAVPTSSSLPFGNPFFTSFDEGAPVVNMQDLWGNNIFDSNLSDMNLWPPQQSGGAGHFP